MSIEHNLNSLIAKIPSNVTLIAVSKTQPETAILAAYNNGQRAFGENKIQEMVEKYSSLPKDIQWHMIGHLQTNKIKYMASFVHVIHGVDSLKKLQEIDKQAKKHNRIINCLLQIKIASEDTKFGMNISEAEEIAQSSTLLTLKNCNIIGLMGMATFTNNEKILIAEFQNLKNCLLSLQKYQSFNFNLKELSMGMSSDYQIAINQGSTMVRIGSSIFGERTYN